MAQTEISNRQLLRRGPVLMLDHLPRLLLAAQLDLWRHQQNGVLAGVYDGEQHNHLLASVEDLADARPQPMALHLVTFWILAIKYGKMCLFLAFEQAVERVRFGLGRRLFDWRIDRVK